MLPKYISPKAYEEVLKYRRARAEVTITKIKKAGFKEWKPPLKPGREVIRKPTNVEREGEVSIQLVALWRVSPDGIGFHDQWGYSKNRPEGQINFDEMLEETRRSALGQAGGSDLLIEGPLDHYWKRFEFVG